MKKIAMLTLLLAACGKSEYPVEPDGCGLNPNFEKVETQEICMNSMRCVNDGDVRLSNFICFCDQLCLCFFSVTDDCDFRNEECSKYSGVMTLLSSDFCLFNDKQEILEKLNDQVGEVNGRLP